MVCICAEGHDGHSEVQTAAPSEGLLEGIMRRQVLQVASRLLCVYQAPAFSVQLVYTHPHVLLLRQAKPL